MDYLKAEETVVRVVEKAMEEKARENIYQSENGVDMGKNNGCKSYTILNNVY